MADEESWFSVFPEMDRLDQRELRKAVDSGFREFSGDYGGYIEAFFDPLKHFLIASESFLLETPWLLILAGILVICWFASRNWKIVVGAGVALCLVGFFGMWEDTMRTLSIVFVCTVMAIVIGMPLGVMMAMSNRAQSVVTPILDIMQTMPSFVYLIPVVMLLGIGKVPGLIAVVVYAIPPLIRLTNLGIRLVDKEVLEAADAFGASKRQKLFGVQIPLALPNIMAGVNQTIMMALSMVVVASMIGVKGLGQPVLKAINTQQFFLGVMNGLAIVVLAILFDRVTQAYGLRIQKHRSQSH
ncbi:MAG: proline/glycine betaine ABC transporter permease [Alphaproteobacteria bacterium]|nr:proline/glycine betaine ABC transporter permease [Alphaproteobacteria bacterium]